MRGCFGPLQIGIVLVLLGIGLLFLRNAGPDMNIPMLVLGTVVLMPGVGFIISAGITWVLAGRLRPDAREARRPQTSWNRPLAHRTGSEPERDPAVAKKRMSLTAWESALSNVLAPDANTAGAQASSPPMDDQAFAGFYERSARSLWAYLARTSGDPALAEDLMQESYVRFLCAPHSPSQLAEGEVAARRYLFRIATNLLRDHWRRPRTASIEEIPEDFFAQPAAQRRPTHR